MISILIFLWREKKNKINQCQYYAGVELVRILLETFLSEEQIKQIIMVTLNPALYKPPTGADDPLLVAYNKKLDMIGLPKDAKEGKAEGLQLARQYPPQNFKNQHLCILRTLKGVQLNEMVLIDDKAENVSEALDLGAYGVFVPGKKALAWVDLTIFLSPDKSPEAMATRRAVLGAEDGESS